jgi:hypothetical protein
MIRADRLKVLCAVVALVCAVIAFLSAVVSQFHGPDWVDHSACCCCV